MHRHSASSLFSGFCLTAFIFSSLAAQADGFRNPPEGARAIGAFGGFRVFADDANAVIHNSANLTKIGRPTLQLNFLGGYGRNRFETDGVSERTVNPWFALPGVAAVVPVSDRFAAGIAFYVPYGRSVEWKRDGYFAQRGLPYAGSMMVADLTPNVALQLNNSFALGAGLDLYYGRVEQDALLYGLSALGIPDGTRGRLAADGDAVGWNAAATWQLTARQRLAATFRSPFSINYQGEHTLSGGMKTDAEARIHYPAIVALAYGVMIKDTVRAEINGEWLEFSRYRNLTVHDEVFGSRTYPQHQKDTWTAGLGLEWAWHPLWTLRSGYKYLKNPTPDATYSPLSADADQGVVSLGIGYERNRHAVDVGLAYGLFDGRRIPDSNPAGGKYDYDVRLVSISYGYHF